MTTALLRAQGLRQLLVAATAVATALRLVPRPRPPRPALPALYDLADPRAAEEAIVRDALAGTVAYRRGVTRTGMELILHGSAERGDVVVRLGHGGSVGMRVVVRVNGVDLSEHALFDAHRVAAAVLEGRDLRACRPRKTGRAG